MRGMKYAFGNADLPAGTAPAGHSRIDRPKVKRNARPGAGSTPCSPERDTFYWKNQVMP